MTSTNVVDLPVITKLDLPANKVLKAAAARNVTDVIVLGYDQSGKFYFAASLADGGEALWLLELAKKQLLEAG